MKGRVVVAGGGLAGITAALELAEAGIEVTLVEARPRLGGATFSFTRRGLSFDNGQHVFLRCCTEYRRLLATLRVEHLTAMQPHLSIPVLRNGKAARFEAGPWPAPAHLLPSVLRYRHLSISQRLAVGRAVLGLRQLSEDDPSLDGITFGSWLQTRGQSDAAIAGLWDLIALPTLNLSSRDASLALAVKVFRTGVINDRSAGEIGYARVPLSDLHGTPAAAELRRRDVTVLTSTTVCRVAPGPRVVTDQEEVQADAVVVALPHNKVGAVVDQEILEGSDPARLGSSPILNVHAVLDRRITDLPFVAVLDSPLQYVFDRTDSAGARRGQVLSISVSGADEVVDLPAEKLKAVFVPELLRIFGAKRVEVLDVAVTRERHATFRQTPGSLRLRPGPRTRSPHIYLAGAWTDTGWPATMEGAVRSGRTAARCVLEDDVVSRREVVA